MLVLTRGNRGVHRAWPEWSGLVLTCIDQKNGALWILIDSVGEKVSKFHAPLDRLWWGGGGVFFCIPSTI